MPLYSITGPDGNNYQIEGPEGATREQVIAAVQRRLAQQQLAQQQAEIDAIRNRPAPPPETTVGGNVKEFFKGLVPGAIGLGETAGTGIAALLPDDTEKSVRDAIKEYAGIAKKPFAAAPGYEESVGRKLGEAGGSTLPFFALGPLGAPGVVAGAGLGVAAGAGEAREAAEQKGATAEERRTATLLGAPTGLLDIIAPEVPVLTRVLKKELGPIQSMMATAAARGGIEGATEASQKIAQNLIARGVYDPNQPIMAGSGEEGAYGAGVGALASLVMDLTVGRKGRARALQTQQDRIAAAQGEGQPPAAPPADTSGIAGLAAEPQREGPLTPEQLAQRRADRQRAVAFNEQAQQADLFPGEKQQAELALARQQGPAKPAEQVAPAPQERTAAEAGQGELFTGEQGPSALATAQPDLFGEFTPEREQQPAAEQAAPAAPADTQTRDMIDELETRQIEELLSESPDKATDPEKDRLKFLSDLETFNNQMRDKDQKTLEEKRLALLTPLLGGRLIAEHAFRDALRANGITDLNLTEREKALIARANDVRLAEPAPTPVEVAPSAPAQNQSMEALIPERKDTRTPEQPSFPGMGKPKGPAPQAFSEEELAGQAQRDEKQFPTVLTATVLDGTGLPRQSGFYKQLLGKDMADPAQQPQVAQVLVAVRANPSLSPATKQAIERVAMNAFGGLAKQGEMFGPRGGVIAPAGGTNGRRGENAGNVPAGTGAGAGSGAANARPAQPATAAADTARAEAPQPSGLGDSGKPAGQPATRAAAQPAALNVEPKAEAPKPAAPAPKAETKAEPKVEAKPEPKAETKAETKAVPEVNVAWEMLQRAEEAQRKAEEAQRKAEEAAQRAEKSTKTEAPKAEAPKTEAKAEAPKTEPKAKKEEKAPEMSGLEHLGAYADMNRVDALRRLAHVIYTSTYPQKNVTAGLNEINAALSRNEFPADLKFGTKNSKEHFAGQSGPYAKAYFESLNATDRASLMAELQEYFGVGEQRTAAYLARMNARQIMDREIIKQMDQNPELRRDSAQLSQPLHPEVMALLKQGDLSGALLKFAGNMTGRNARIARALASALKGVKVEVVDNLRNAKDEGLAGDFDRASNTVRLDMNTGLNVHTLIHEVVHALTVNTLSNKSHPVTKQLNDIFNAVKGQLDTAYGTQSLEEFVSEAMSNPEFQAKLAGMYTDAKPISALKKFFHAVGNLVRNVLGMDPTALGSALDAVDVLSMQLIAPNSNAFGTGALYQASLIGAAKGVFGAMDQQILGMPAMNNGVARSIYEAIRQKVPGAAKTTILSSLPLNALVEVATPHIPMAKQLDTLEKLWSGAVDKRRSASDATVRRIQKWTDGDVGRAKLLNEIVAESTLAGVDPSKDVSTYAGKFDDSGNSLEAAWRKMQPTWSKMGAEGQAVYKQMRDSYAKTHEDLINLLYDRIDASVSDKDTAKKLRSEIYQRLATRGKIEPYFPLMRSGDFWVSFTRGGEYYKMAFKTSVERDLAIKELRADKAVDLASINKSTPTKKLNYRDAPSTSFVNDLLKVLDVNKVDPEVTEQVMRMFLEALPETSFAQSFRKRMGVLGFNTDATEVFASRSASMAHQLANLEYSAKMYKLRDDMQKYVNENDRSEATQLVYDTLERHIKSMVSPRISPLAKAASSAIFGWTLGGNVSSALVNMVQVPMVLMPHLGGKYGYGAANKAIGSATRIFLGSGLKRHAEMSGTKGETIEVRGGFSLDNYDFDAKDTPKELKELKELASLAADYGLLHRSTAQDILEQGAKETVLDKINKYSGLAFHHAERMNRQLALIATYKLELDKMRKAKKGELTEADRKKAAQTAVETAEIVNGGATANSAPLIAKSSIGKVAFMYKRYGVAMYYMLFKTTRDAMIGEDPEVRKAAKRQLAGIYASTALLAGVQGLPMFGIIGALYNLFLQDDDDDDFETAARKWMGEGYFNGALNALTGTAVANRISLTDLLINDTGYRNQDNAILAALQLIGGPAYGTADRIFEGVKMIMDGEVQRGLERAAPSALANLSKAYRYGSEGMNTMRGDPVVSDVGAGDVVAQAFGFAPADYMRQLEINGVEKNIERRVVEERSKLLKRRFIALRSGDSEGFAEATEKLLKMNEKHPGFVTPETLQKSLDSSFKTSAQMYHGVTFNQKLRAELLADAAEFDGE